ncbi:MAG TPA: MAC/perforin domain-containing protein [Micromonosporaceae bacterium]|nr:MAC/perforin domain-containing protein [Micromonosporaceae bacterium]
MLETAAEGSLATLALAKVDVLYLGKGVDVLTYDPFSAAPPSKDQVVDLDACQPQVIDDAPELSYDTMVKKGYTEFTKSLAVEAGLRVAFGAFSSGIDSKFSSTAKNTTETYFARVQATCRSKTLTVGQNVRMLTKYLSAEFNEALRSATPEEILDSFGTHVAVTVQYGGRCSYLVSSTATTELNEQEFKVTANAKYAAVSGETGVDRKSSETIRRSEESTSVTVVGGDTTAVVADKPDGLADWMRSVPDHPGFLGFTRDGLVPIWMLAGARHDELYLAFRRRAALHPVIRIFEQTSEKAAEWPMANVEVPSDYKLLSGGAKVLWSPPGNFLVDSYPSSDETWTAQSRSHLKPSAATITAYAVGLYDPPDWELWDVQPFKAKGTKGPAPSAMVVVPKEYTMVGGGGHDDTTSGMGNHLRACYPEDDRWVVTGSYYDVESVGEATAYAVGLRCNVPGVEVKRVIKVSEPSQQQSTPVAEQSMEHGYVLVGGGARCEWSGKGQILTASYPGPEGHSWHAASKEHVHADPGRVTAYAIGIKVTATATR